MRPTVLFIHSAGPQEQNQGSSPLIAYLEEELSNDFHFIHPTMPEPENPMYLDWKQQLDSAFNELTGNVILVGHSLGGSVLLKYLSEEPYNITVSGLFVIASPFWGLDENWQRNDFTFQENFEQQLNEIPQVFLYHSREEEIVPFSHHKAYAEKLPQAAIRELAGEQHLFHRGIPELIQDIKSLFKGLDMKTE